MLRIKICGMTQLDDARLACELGADAIGFIFYAKSPRSITMQAAAMIAEHVPAHVAKVGVFVDLPPVEIARYIETVNLQAVQLHGDYSLTSIEQFDPEQVIAVARVGETFRTIDLERFQGRVAAILLDTQKRGVYGGTGETFDWQVALEAKAYGRIILAGGLNPENVCQAVETVAPYALDVSSGVEAGPGRKDAAKLQRLFHNLKTYRDAWKPDLSPRFPIS